MKRFSLIFLFALTALIVPQAASAHVLKTDGSIGAVMHIDPDDDPIVSQPATFFFELKDKQNKFTPTQCDCTATILRDAKIIFSAALFKDSSNNNINNAAFSYTFTERAVYTIQISGKPTNDSAFQSFILNFDVRVDREPTGGVPTPSAAAPNHTIHYLIFGGGFLAFFLLLLKDKFKHRPAKNIRLHAITFIVLCGLTLHHTHAIQAICHSHDATSAQEHQCCFAPATALAPPTNYKSFLTSYRQVTVILTYTKAILWTSVNNKSPPISL